MKLHNKPGKISKLLLAFAVSLGILCTAIPAFAQEAEPTTPLEGIEVQQPEGEESEAPLVEDADQEEEAHPEDNGNEEALEGDTLTGDEELEGEDDALVPEEEEALGDEEGANAMATLFMDDGIMPLNENLLQGFFDAAADGSAYTLTGDIQLVDSLTLHTDTDITLTLKSTDSATITSANKRHLVITGTGKVTLVFENVVLDGENAQGGVSATSHVTLVGAVIQNCHNPINDQDLRGGGVYAAAGLTLENSTLAGNQAYYGAGVYVSSGDLQSNGSTFQGNEGQRGAAGYALGNVAIHNTVVANNKVNISLNQSGAGFFIDGPNTTIDVDGLEGYGNEGAVLYASTGADNMQVYLRNLDLHNNQRSTISIQNNTATTYMISGNVYDNTDPSSGAGMHISGTLHMQGGKISSNRVEVASVGYYYGGGGVAAGTMIMSGGEISGNIVELKDLTPTTDYGAGGAGVRVTEGFTMSGGSITGNKIHVINSPNSTIPTGAGVLLNYIYSGAPHNITITGGTISDNGMVTDGSEGMILRGGGIATRTARSVDITITGGAIINNEGGWGGALYAVCNADQYLNLTIGGASETQYANISGNEALYGGAVYVARGTDITVEGYARVEGNTAETSGGALYVQNAKKMTFDGNAKLLNNLARNGGGGYIRTSDKLVVQGNVLMQGNEANYGGALYAYGMEEAIIQGDTVVTGNKAETYGGGFYFTTNPGLTTIKDNVIFSENSSENYSGGVFQYVSPLNIEGNVKFVDNEAPNAAGLLAWKSDTTIRGNVKFTGNTGTLGSAVMAMVCDLDMEDVEVTGNTSVSGNIYATTDSVVTLKGNSLVHGNTATSGGAATVTGTARLILEGTTKIYNNTALGNGGGIYLEDLETLTASSGTAFYNNTALLGYDITDADDIALHDANILSGQFTAPYTRAYNNHDIYYLPDVNVIFAYNYAGSPNNGVYQVVNIPTQAPMDNDAIPADPTRAGYSFDGWYTDEECTAAWDNARNINLPLTLYAGWIAGETRALSYDTDGGAPVPDTENVPIGGYATRPANPSKEGHTFLGWTDEAGEKWCFIDDATPTPMPSDDVKLYAQYEAHMYGYTIEYANGQQPTLGNAAFGTYITAPAQPSRAGYTFNGWKLDDGSAWNFATNKMPARAITITAQWQEVVTTPGEGSEAPTTQPETTAPTTTSKSGGGGGGGGTAASTPTTTSYIYQSSSAASSSSGSPSSSSEATAAGSETESTSAAESTTAEPENEPKPVVVVDDEDENAYKGAVLTLGGMELPLGGVGQKTGWSVFNLLLALVSLVGGAFGTLRLVKANRRWKRMQGRMDDLEDNAPSVMPGSVWLWLASLTSLLAPILFLILEDFSGVMLFTSRTPAIVVCVVINIGLNFVAAKLSSPAATVRKNRP